MNMEITFPGGKKVDALYQGFYVKTDQPKNEGGEGSAPEPFSLFLISIGTCTGIYVLDFLQNRNISTDGLKIILRIEKDGDKSPMIKNIKIDIYPPKNFPDRYNNAILKAAALCTVKRQLEHPPTIDITLKK